ncbi:MAG: hypothetical protein CM15mP125_4040 [Gammaproteobacteria bacterium]|nr:MAG: hypothetical protein CM15mP125_4040 [Gammaproteobacteria bacterium]
MGTPIIKSGGHLVVTQSGGKKYPPSVPGIELPPRNDRARKNRGFHVAVPQNWPDSHRWRPWSDATAPLRGNAIQINAGWKIKIPRPLGGRREANPGPFSRPVLPRPQPRLLLSCRLIPEPVPGILALVISINRPVKAGLKNLLGAESEAYRASDPDFRRHPSGHSVHKPGSDKAQ